MMRFIAGWVLAATLACISPAFAQDETLEDAVVSEQALPAVFANQAEWDALNDRASAAVLQGRASSSALSALRAELATWRDTFLGLQSTNSARIATVRSQIAALGAVPEDGEEDPRVAARRAELTTELQQLNAPVVLAREAFSRADGLISEIDGLIRDRQAERFTERRGTPLAPARWALAWDNLGDIVRSNLGEMRTAIDNPSRQNELTDNLPLIFLLLAVAVVCILRGRRWYNAAASAIVGRLHRGQGALRFVLSLGQIIIPFIGVLALSTAIQATGMTGRRLGLLIDELAALALYPILAHWIAGQLLPKDVTAEEHPLSLDAAVSSKVNRRFIFLGYSLFLFGLMFVFVNVNGFDADVAAVLMFPFGAVMAWTLYWFGHMLRRTSTALSEDTAGAFRVTLRSLLGRGVMVASVVGLLGAAFGYSNAFEVITQPAAVTVYVLAVLILFQNLSVDVYSALVKTDGAAQTALMPVVIGFLLILCALPVLALIWGAQTTDLTELWARFRAGFSIGETQISPTSFLLFAVVFVAGYTVTRLLQAALRTTVLPRTKLDAGGQNAIVAGTGYIGIFLAAIIAITMAGIDLSGLAIVAGALSVGIGFGMQNIVSNFVSGIILLIERPISKGDWIEVGGQMGYVRDISVRSTRIETFDRTDVIVPNADLVSNQVTNWTRGNSVGRVIVPVGVAYGTDTQRVTDILREIAESHAMVVLNPPPAVLFKGFGADSLDFEIRAILRDINWMVVVASDMNHEIAKRFAQEGIEIPFAQRDLWLRNPESLRAAMDPTPPTGDA